MRFVTPPLPLLLISKSPVLATQLLKALATTAPLNTALTAQQALATFTSQQTPLVILDMQSGENQLFDAVTQLRQERDALGLIGITDGLRLQDKWRALRQGVDHVLSSPWSADELNASLDNLALRLRPIHQTANDSMLQLDARFQMLRGPASEQALSRSEYLLLLAFAKALNQQLDIWEIYDALNKDEHELPKQAVEAQIYRLRKKLRDAGAGKQVLKSIRLQGYQLCSPIKIN